MKLAGGSGLGTGPLISAYCILELRRVVARWLRVNAANRLRCLLIGLAVVTTAWAAPVRIVILHTNDIHDHVRVGYGGEGGLPHVSGYVRQVRAAEPAVLVLDAGDVAEKGDMVAFKTDSRISYEAVRRVGYDGVAVGNHDFDPHGAEGIRRFERLLGQPMLCLNIVKPDGTPEFTPSRIVEAGGLKVGLIGMIAPRDRQFGGLDFAASGKALDREARRLRPQVDLLVAICHEGVPKCAEWSKAAPGVQVFVSGHSHVALARPEVVPETGALIVQAGSYARWVGRLELDIDRETKKIVHYDGRLVPMRSGAVPVDAATAAWIAAREREICPEASEVVAHNAAPVGMLHTAWLCADSLRRAAGTDLAFCHAGNIMRSPLPAGDVDMNALFVAGGQRGDETVRFSLSGAQVKAYLEALGADEDHNQTAWSGMRVTRHGSEADAALATNLQPARVYSVIMPKLEWTTRFAKMARKAHGKSPGGALAGTLPVPQPSPVQLTEALRVRVKALTGKGRSLADEARALALAATDTPDDPKWWRTGSETEPPDPLGAPTGGK